MVYMRIGIFTDTYLPVANGICYVIEIIKKDLEAAGHEVWVVAPRDVRWNLPKESRIIRFSAIGGVLFKDQFNSFFWPSKQLRQIKALNLDLILAFTPSQIGAFGAYCSAKLDTPYIIQYGTDMEEYAELYKTTTIVGILGSMLLAPYLLKMGLGESWKFFGGYFIKPDKKLSYYKSITRHILSALHLHSQVVIATSEKIAKKLEAWPIKQNVEVIPTGVNQLPTDKNYKIYFANKYGLHADDEIILYAGRLSVEKNLNLLIDSFELVAQKRPRSKLLLVGDFQYRQNLEQKTSQSAFKERIIFTGQIERNELGSVYELGTVFAFPSITDCQALVLNEAAHAGLPLVWCDEQSLNSVLKDGLSGLQARNNKNDFASKILKILNDKKLKNKLGAGANKLAQDYTEAKQTKKLEKLLQEIIKV